MSNERTATWLRGLGYDPEPEPVWITAGRKPDFFARSAAPLWVEVKTLAQDPYQEAMGMAWDDLRSRCKTLVGTGGVYALLGEFDEQANKVAMGFLSAAAIASRESASAQVIMIPGTPDYAVRVRIEYPATDGIHVVQTGPASVDGTYHHYPTLEPHNWRTQATIYAPDGTVKEERFYRVFSSRDPFKLAMRIFPSDDPIMVRSVGAAEARQVGTRERLRNVVADAASQLRNGQKYAAAPGVIVLHWDHLPGAGVEDLLSAMFGDLTIAIDRNPVRSSGAFFGRNGILQPDKNRGVSAVVFFGPKGNPITILNPYTSRAIAVAAIGTEAWVLEGEHFVLRGS